MIVWPVDGEDGKAEIEVAGPRLATITGPVATSVAPLSSVTRRRMVYVPLSGKLASALEAFPSSKLPSLSRSQAKDVTEPSGSLDVDVRVMVSSVSGPPGELLKDADGDWFPIESTLLTCAWPPLSSVTRRPTV